MAKYLHLYTATRLYMTVMYKLYPCVSQSSKSSTAQQVASCAHSLSSLLHVSIGHHQISVSRRRQ